jgi:signal peptidase I
MDHPRNAAVTTEVSGSEIATKWTRRVLPAALSSVLPGAGQLWLGKKKAGVAFLGAFCLLTLLYWPARLPTWFAGVQVLFFTAMGLCVAAAWHALRAPSQERARSCRWWLVLFIPLALTASFAHSNWLLLVAGFRPFDIPSTGMEQTVSRGDRVMVDLKAYRHSKPKAHDVLIFRKDRTFFMKRVLAVGGDTIEGKDGMILVNHQQLEEPYVQHLGNAPVELNQFGPMEIPTGQLFVAGDNRDVSRDSRLPEFGLVSEESIAGKGLYIIRSKRKRVGTDLR